MTTSNRFVFDTNVLVSALLFDESKPARAFFRAAQIGTLLTSLDALHELNDVLHRKKFDRYVTLQERTDFLYRYTQRAVIIEIVQTVHICRDPKDDKFLDIAINGNASTIISGDPDLLVLNPFRGIEVISPDTFLQNDRFDVT